MLTNLGRLVADRLGTIGGGVAVWAKRRAQEGVLPALVYDVQLGAGVKGSAPVGPALLVVNCYASTSDAVEALAAQVQALLREWSAWGYDVGLLGAELTNAQQDYDDDKGVWYAVLSYAALAVTGE